MRTVALMVEGLFFWLALVALMIRESHKEKVYAKRRRVAELWRWYDEHYGVEGERDA